MVRATYVSRVSLVVCGWIAFFVSYSPECSSAVMIALQAVARVLP